MRHFIEKVRKMKLETAIVLPAVIFSINILIGRSFSQYGDFSYIFGSSRSIAKSAGLLVVYTVIFSVILYLLFNAVGKICCNGSEKVSPWTVFGISFVVLVLCYAPYLFAHYPGSINSDSTGQLAEYFGYIENTNHHPVFSTWLMGTCVRIGTAIQSNGLGVFLYVILQTVILAAAFANTLRVMVKWKMPIWLVVCAGIYYAVFPLWGGYAQLMIKDTLYSAVVVLFVTIFLELLLEAESSEIKIWKICRLIFVGIFTMLLRNNGVYVVIPCLVAGVVFVGKRLRKKWWIALIACAGFYWAWGNMFLPAMQIPDGSIREALSVPFQQTARYINEYADEVTAEERAAIDAVLAYDKIGVNYVDFGADPVKNTYKEPEDETAKLGNYFKHWLLMFFKHPSVYFEATVANSYYYYCANVNGSFEPIFLNYIYYDENTACFDLEQREETAELRQGIYEYTESFQNLPIFGELFSQGFYTYVLIGMMGFLCYWKRPKYIVGLLPSMLSVLICIASPVNGSYRYFLPVIACTWICMAYCVRSKSNKS